MQHALPYIIVAFGHSHRLILLLVVVLLLPLQILSQLLKLELLLLDPELELLVVHVLLLVVLRALHQLLVYFPDFFYCVVDDGIEFVLFALLGLRVLVLLVDFLGFELCDFRVVPLVVLIHLGGVFLGDVQLFFQRLQLILVLLLLLLLFLELEHFGGEF